ncbi:unnamed protein product [Chrysoparadoxa australica]
MDGDLVCCTGGRYGYYALTPIFEASGQDDLHGTPALSRSPLVVRSSEAHKMSIAVKRHELEELEEARAEERRLSHTERQPSLSSLKASTPTGKTARAQHGKLPPTHPPTKASAMKRPVPCLIFHPTARPQSTPSDAKSEEIGAAKATDVQLTGSQVKSSAPFVAIKKARGQKKGKQGK